MDGKLCLWETGRRKCVDLFGHQGSITKVSSDLNHNVAISIGYDGKILIWSFPQVQALSISQQRRSGARASSASAISPAAELIGHKAPILECSYHNNGGMRGVLASGDRDGKVIIWEIESGSMIARYKGHNGPITAMDAITNSASHKSYFVTGGSDGMVKVNSFSFSLIFYSCGIVVRNHLF
jgi:WD40 repeat protein